MRFFRRPRIRIVTHKLFEPDPTIPHPALGWFECAVDDRRGWHVLVFRECDGALGVWFGAAPHSSSKIEGLLAAKVRRFVRRSLRGGA